MFVRKKPNKSGVVSIQIIEKRLGKSVLIKTVGSSSDPDKIDSLCADGSRLLSELQGQQSLAFDQLNEEQLVNLLFRRHPERAIDISLVARIKNETKGVGKKQWNGLKGYSTNTKLTRDEIIENYNHLWQTPCTPDSSLIKPGNENLLTCLT